MSLIHGRIKIHIKEARKLQDKDWNPLDWSGKYDVSDPYVTGMLGNLKLFKTRYIKNELNPKWDTHYNVYVCHSAHYLKIKVKDKDAFGLDDSLGEVTIKAEDLITGKVLISCY